MNSLNYKPQRTGILQRLGFKHHEYWPWWMLVAPIWPLWAWYMIRTGKLTWFTAVNPGMEDSGFLGESKIKILNSIPDEYKPITVFIPHHKNFDELNELLPFPCIAKPDVGGRGRKIKIIHSIEELELYHHEIGEDYMIQEIIPYELELGIFYVRMPYEKKGEIVSISEKEFLDVIGDGTSTVKELMQKNYRASLQIDRLESIIDLNEILPLHEKKLLEPIGNHCRGTIFRDRGNLINDQLTNVMDEVCSKIDGFFYGRFDLRVKSIEDLMQGRHIQIMELNGLTSDPAHIFDPNARLRDAIKTQLSNCKKSYQIAKYNLKHGAKTTPIVELYRKSKNGF